MRTPPWLDAPARNAPVRAASGRAARPAALVAMLTLGLIAGFALRAVATAGAGAAIAPARASVPITPPAAGEGYATIAQAVMPTVVNISSLHVIKTYERWSPFMADPFFQQFFGGGGYDYIVPRERRELSLGSG